VSLKLTTDRHKASRCLSAIAELLVIKQLLNTNYLTVTNAI